MATTAQKKRRRLIQMAEGYLDLAVAFEDRWALAANHRDTLAERAMECLDEISNPLGYKPYILFLKGQAHRVAGRFFEATRLYKQSLQLEPEDLSCLLSIAWCYKRIDRLELAIESLQTAIQIDPESAICHYNLACYWALAGNVDDAVTHLTTAIELNENYRSMVAQESDFDLIRQSPGFQAIFSIKA